MLKPLLAMSALTVSLLLALRPAEAGPAPGDTVFVNAETETTGDTAIISFAGLPAYGNQPAGTSLDVYTAPVILAGTFGAASTAFNNLLAYCTDLYNFSSTPATYTVSNLTSTTQPTGGIALSTTQLNDIATLINENNADQAATQLAIWSVEYGNAFSFSNASGNTAADEASYIAALDGSAPQGVILYQLQDPGVQGFAFVAPVPEPATLTVLVGGLLGVGVARRRKAG